MEEVWNNLFSELPSQTEQSGEKDLVKRGDQEPNGYSGWVPEILYGDGRNF